METKKLGSNANFGVVLSVFLLQIFLSWPQVLSFDLWIFKDRSSLLNLDYLFFTKHLKIGVDVCYSYGLLPLLLQHLAFLPVGRGFRPMVVCNFLVLPLFALFWALLLEHLPPQRVWLFVVVLISPLVYLVNLNWPYTLVTLSMLFALLFVLRDRLDFALAISVVGCFCVPSLPLVLTGLLTVCLVLRWWRLSRRSMLGLAILFAPGIAAAASLAILLSVVFGLTSLLATLLPFAGARYYSAVGYARPGAFLEFLRPSGYSTKYYVAYYFGSHVTWFVLSFLFLCALSVFVLRSRLRSRWLDPSGRLVVLFTVVFIVFVFLAYGPRGEHSIYESELAAVTLIGLSMIHHARWRMSALLFFVGVGALAESANAYKTMVSWRTTSVEPDTLGLYANAGIAQEWAEVLREAQHHKVFLLSYATGQHVYYPNIEESDAWFVVPKLLFPAQESAIGDQIEHADLVVEDMTSPSPVIDSRIQSELATMHEVEANGSFRILQH